MALWHGTWCYTRSTCDEKDSKIFMNHLAIYYTELECHTPSNKLKGILKGLQIATIFPVSERWTTNMNPREILEFLDTSKTPVHCMDQLMTVQWFLQETQDAANYLEHLLNPEMRMSVSHLTVKQVLFFAKMNSHLFNHAHEMRPVPLQQMFLGDRGRW